MNTPQQPTTSHYNPSFIFPLNTSTFIQQIADPSIYFNNNAKLHSVSSSALNETTFCSTQLKIKDNKLFFLSDRLSINLQNLYSRQDSSTNTLILTQLGFHLTLIFPSLKQLFAFILDIDLWVISNDPTRFIPVKELDKGCFGAVQLMRDSLKANKLVTLKSVALPGTDDPTAHRSLLNEVHILRQIRHPNVLKLYSVIQIPNAVCLITEYINGGTLENFIAQNQADQQTALEITHSLLLAVKQANLHFFVHRDIKPSNIMFKTSHKTGKRIWKLIDFGLSEDFTDFSVRSLMKDRTGTVCYMAPEILDPEITQGVYNQQVDLFSIGVVLFEMFFY